MSLYDTPEKLPVDASNAPGFLDRLKKFKDKNKSKAATESSKTKFKIQSKLDTAGTIACSTNRTDIEQAAIEDVSELRQREKQLRKHEKARKASEKAQKEYLGGMAWGYDPNAGLHSTKQSFSTELDCKASCSPADAEEPETRAGKTKDEWGIEQGRPIMDRRSEYTGRSRGRHR